MKEIKTTPTGKTPKTITLKSLAALGAIPLFGFALPADAADTKHQTKTEKTEADNSKRNEQIQASGEMTAEDQGNSSTDISTTQQIRQEIVKDKSFSYDANQVKIITRNGRVVLKGPVESATEKTRIDEIARRVAGASNVTNNIEVKQR